MTKDLDKKVAHAMELQYERGFIDGMQKQMQSSVDKAVNAMSQTQEPVPPPWWTAVENILNEYGLQAIDFVADFKQALAKEQEPVACAECERLRGELKKANDQAEHFEREWYLRGFEIERLKAQTQEPVAWYHAEDYKTHFTTNPSPDLIGKYWKPLYTHPPQRTWVDLTDEEIDNINYTSAHMLAREVLAKFKEKNT